MRRQFRTHLLGSSIFLFALSAWGWKVGVVIGAKDLAVEREGVSHRAQSGFTLRTGDKVSTSASSRAVLVENSSRLILAAGTTLTVEPAPAATKIQLNVDTGSARAVIDKETAPKYDFKIRTAVAGVRGTEFFLSSGETAANLCVLEGAVAAVMSNGDAVDVPQGLGISAAPATRPLFAPTPLETVSSWRAETSEEELPAPVFPSAYETAAAAPERTWGTVSNTNWLDVNACKNTTADIECLRVHSFHRFLWPLPANFYFQATPLLQWNTSKPMAFMDSDPPSAREEDLQVRPYELILQKNIGTSQFLEGGVKPITVGQPLFIGARRFSTEPASSPFVEYRNGRALLQAALPVSERRPLDGLPSYSLTRAGYDLPWGTSHVGVLSIEDSSQRLSGYRFLSPQFSWSDRFADTTLAVSAIHESGERRVPLGKETHSESLADVSVEQLFSAGGTWRAKARVLRTSREYLAPQIDSYALGIANMISIADLEQRRLTLGYALKLAGKARLEIGGESLESYVASTSLHQASETNAWIGWSEGAAFLRLHGYSLRQPALETRGWMLLGSLAY